MSTNPYRKSTQRAPLIGNSGFVKYRESAGFNAAWLVASIVALLAIIATVTLSGIILNNTNNINSNTNSIETSIMNIDSSVGNIDSSITNIDSSITNIDSSISNIDSSITNIDSSITNIDTSVSNIDTTVTALNARYKDCQVIIDALPYTIDSPGHYCLGQDFTWAETTVGLIIVNTSSVHLDFCGHGIVGTVDSSEPIMDVDNIKGLTIKRLWIQGEDAAQYSRVGLSITNIEHLFIDDLRLITLGQCILAQTLVDAKFTNWHINAGDPNLCTLVPLQIADVVGLYMADSIILNQRPRFRMIQNAIFERNTFDNRIPSSRSIISNRAFQLTSVNPDDPQNAVGPRLTNGVTIRNSHFRSESSGILVLGFLDGAFVFNVDIPVLNVVIDDCVVDAFEGIMYQFVFGGVIKNNQINTITGGSFMEGIMVLSSEDVTVQDNHVRGNGIDHGILMMGLNYSPYNTVRDRNSAIRNVVSGAEQGYADGNTIFGTAGECRCCLFRDNIAQESYTLGYDLGAASTVSVDNIESCAAVKKRASIASHHYGTRMLSPESIEAYSHMNRTDFIPPQM